MRRNQAIAILMALPLLLATGGCGDDAGAADATVTIAFEHLANDMPIVLGSETPYTNAAGNEFGTTRSYSSGIAQNVLSVKFARL